MKIIHRNTSSKIPIVVCGVIAFVLLGGLAYAHHYAIWPFQTSNTSNDIDLNPATADQTKAGETTKQNSLDNSDTKQGVSGSDQPPAPTQHPGSAKNSVDITITAANQSNNTLQIRTLISTVVNDGSCNLTFTNNSGKKVTYTADVQPLSTTSTCKGFDIPTSELSPGNWSMVVAYDSNTLAGSASKNITIK